MAHPIVSTVTIIAANSALIAASQQLNAPALTVALTSPTVTLDAPRRVIVTSVGNDSGINFTITGTARNELGNVVQSETITGATAGNAASTTQDFLTVTSVVASGATASTITVGTNGVASGPWVPWDMFPSDFQVTLQVNVLSGAPGWTVEVTNDDVFGTFLPAGVPFPRPYAPVLMVGTYGAITTPVRASRLTLASVGSVQLTQQQQGN